MADKGTRLKGRLLSTTAAPTAKDGEDGKKNRLRKRPEPGAVALSYSEDDAATTAGCGRSTIRRAIDAGDLPAHKLGRRTLILNADLRTWLSRLPARAPSRKAA